MKTQLLSCEHTEEHSLLGSLSKACASFYFPQKPWLYSISGFPFLMDLVQVCPNGGHLIPGISSECGIFLDWETTVLPQ